MIDWKSTGYFERPEFDSPDVPGSGDLMDEEFIRLLVQIRQDCGFPFRINSGYRTPSHNADPKVGGKPNGAHPKGKAADIAIATSQQRFHIIASAIGRRIRRIGIGETFVHLDVDESQPDGCIWNYPSHTEETK